MTYFLSSIVLSLGLFSAMLAMLEIGRRIGTARRERDPEGARAGVVAVESAVFGLMGLLIAFTFSGAATRFDARRELVKEEANAIGTAWLRLDLLPRDAQPAVRDGFRSYLDARLEAYRRLPDLAAARRELARAAEIQAEVWARAVASARESGSQPATMLLLPALNQMFDIATTRTVASEIHPPTVVFAMLFALALASALLAGYGMAHGRSRSWLHMIGFAALVAAAIYVILDLEYPRLGLIRVDAADRVLLELRESMG